MTIYLQNALYVHWDTLAFQKTHLAVHQDAVQPLTFLDHLPDRDQMSGDDTVIDCRNKLVTRSFGCGHHHIYSTLARGMPAPLKVPQNFPEILKYVWWHLDKNLDREMIRASALASAMHCAKNGVTFVIDHHASPFAVKDALFTIKEAFDAVGISHLLCYEISNRDGDDPKEAGLAETEAYLQHDFPGLVGLHASFTVDDSLIQKALNLAFRYRSGIHVHVAEDQSDQDHCLKHYQKRVIQRLQQAGALDFPKTILAHGIHLNRQEIELFRNSKAWLVQSVESNLNNNVGLGDYSSYGDRIMLGTDGMHSDMLRSAKAAYLTGQTTGGISDREIYRRFRNIHRYLAENQIPGDSDNNLVILDYDTPTEINPGNFTGHLVFGLESKHVESVIANGRLIVRDRRLQTMDEADILTLAREQGTRLWQKMTN